jgi:hypothetical protein
MEDPVYVFGCLWTSRYKANITYTCIHIPGTDWYIYDWYEGDQRTMRIISCKYHWIGVGIVLSSMVIERNRLIKIIQDFVAPQLVESRQDCRDFARSRLVAWKAHLILERIRRNRAAKTIQRQFRECMSNPAYDLCKRRLLREFADLND